MTLKRVMPNGQENIQIYQESNDPEIQEQNIRKGTVENNLILILGEAGQGKTVLTNMLSEERQQNKIPRTEIFLLEKTGTELDVAFKLFPPQDQEQIKKIREQEEKTATIKELEQNTLIYHPITLDYKHLLIDGKKVHKDLMFPINFYSHSIKIMDESIFSCLLRGEIDDETVNTAYKAVQKLKVEDWFHELVNQIQKGMKETGNFEFDPYKFGATAKISADTKVFNKIVSGLSILRDNPVFMQENSKHNIDFTKIINDTQHRHVFTTKFLIDERLRYINVISNLKAITKALRYGNIKNPITLILEEIPLWVPKKPETIYQNKLLNLILDLLRTGRTMGRGITIICTAQNFQSINRYLFNACNEKYLFRLPEYDQAYFLKNNYMTKEDIEIINSLNYGECVWWSGKRTATSTGKIDSVIIVQVPRYAIHTAGKKFYEIYKQYHDSQKAKNEEVTYPMQHYTGLFAELETFRKETEEKAMQQNKKVWEIEQQALKQKLENRNKKPTEQKPSRLKQTPLLSELMKRCYTLRKDQNQSWEDIAVDNTINTIWKTLYPNKTKITRQTVQKYAIQHKKKNEENQET